MGTRSHLMFFKDVKGVVKRVVVKTVELAVPTEITVLGAEIAGWLQPNFY